MFSNGFPGIRDCAKSMKAAIYRDIGQIGIEQVERKAPEPGYVTIDTKRTGICGSDLHVYQGHWPQSHTLALGHETCGVVMEIGKGVTGFDCGDRVTIECFSHCGQCRYCHLNQYNHCLNRQWISHNTHGGFAEYTTVHSSGLFKIPETMTFEEGALVEPLAVGYRAVGQTRSTHRESVGIIGGGSIGQFCLAAAKAAGIKETLITVKYKHQALLARSLGADHIILIGHTDLEEYINNLTRGHGLDAVIETVGTGRNFNATLNITRPHGVVVLVAGYPNPVEVNLGHLVESEVVVTGSHCYSYTGMDIDFAASIDLMATGKVDTTKFVTHRFSLDAVEEAFMVALDKSSGSIKVHLCQ